VFRRGVLREQAEVEGTARSVDADLMSLPSRAAGAKSRSRSDDA
jgi:hypothetical protein